MYLEFKIIKRHQSRSMQYNRRDIVKVLDKLGIDFTEHGMIITCHIHNIEDRKALETNLRRVHNNVAYFINVIK